jgi:hypothetical protein
MGWLGTLGKIAGFAAAPFTGGLSLLAEPAIGAIEGAQNGGGWAGALKGGAIGGLEAAVPFGVGKALGPALGALGVNAGSTGGKIIGGLLGQEANGLANKGVSALANKANGGTNLSSGGGFGSGAGDLFGGNGSGYAPGGDPIGFDENGNYTTDPSQLYQDLDGNVAEDNPSTGDNTGFVEGGPQDVSAAAAGGQGTGVISKLLGAFKGGLNNATGFGDASKVFGGIENGEANNRYKKGEMTQGYDKLMLQAQTERNQNEADALKKLAQTSYLANGGSHFNPSTIKLNSGTMPNFGFGPSPASEAQKTAAGTLQGQLMSRLAPGGSYMPTTPDYLNRGALENVGQYGGLATGAMGALASIFGPQKQGVNPIYLPSSQGYPGTPPIVAPNNGMPQQPQQTPSYQPSPYDPSNT